MSIMLSLYLLSMKENGVMVISVHNAKQPKSLQAKCFVRNCNGQKTDEEQNVNHAQYTLYNFNIQKISVGPTSQPWDTRYTNF